MRRIAQISDLHFGRHDTAVVEALLASLGEQAPDLVAVCGDLTQRARQVEFIEARRFLDRIVQPKLVVPGNHDVPLYGLHRRLLAPFAKYDRHIASAGVGAFFSDGDIAVLGLNTARRLTFKNGRVSHEQMAEIRTAFAHAPASVTKVVVTHHPLGVPTGAAPVELAGRSVLALQAIAVSGVHLLLSGHHHHAASGGIDVETALHGSVLIVHAGTATSSRVRGEGNTYNMLSIDGRALTVSVLENRPGAGFRERGAASYVFADNAWLRR
jgi:3',5'-cyclic AMP phosphodiesterase CpdA